MAAPELAALLPVAGFFTLLLARSIRQVNQWEAGLKFTLGKYSGRMEPGLNLVIPIFQSGVKIDTRIRNRDLPSQAVITRDNVTAMIDAVIYFKVVDPEKATLNVENFELAVRDRAKVVLRDVVGETTLDELLAHRDEIAAKIRDMVDQFVSRWGLHIELIALQDIQLPVNMQEAIAKKAIAEREKHAIIIKSQADLESAANFAKAAQILVNSPGAMELRRLEALQNITGTGNSKVIFDLAKPSAGEIRAEAAAMGAAMADASTGLRVAPPPTGQRVAAPSAPLSVQDEEATAAMAEMLAGPQVRGHR
jgi:regulator of protease activity HflC (stomatin/prohibitin superfamily)